MAMVAKSTECQRIFQALTTNPTVDDKYLVNLLQEGLCLALQDDVSAYLQHFSFTAAQQDTHAQRAISHVDSHVDDQRRGYWLGLKKACCIDVMGSVTSRLSTLTVNSREPTPARQQSPQTAGTWAQQVEDAEQALYSAAAKRPRTVTPPRTIRPIAHATRQSCANIRANISSQSVPTMRNNFGHCSLRKQHCHLCRAYLAAVAPSKCSNLCPPEHKGKFPHWSRSKYNAWTQAIFGTSKSPTHFLTTPAIAAMLTAREFTSPSPRVVAAYAHEQARRESLKGEAPSQEGNTAESAPSRDTRAGTSSATPHSPTSSLLEYTPDDEREAELPPTTVMEQ